MGSMPYRVWICERNGSLIIRADIPVTGRSGSVTVNSPASWPSGRLGVRRHVPGVRRPRPDPPLFRFRRPARGRRLNAARPVPRPGPGEGRGPVHGRHPALDQRRARPPSLSLGRLGDRREVLGLIDHLKRPADAPGLARDASADQAFALLTSRDVAAAFDVTAEPAAVRDKYGRHTFGQSALLARRLVEAGVTFVTVNTEPWDHHATAGRLSTAEGGRKLVPPFDAAFAALVEDLHQRGLDRRVLVVAMGEFGRTPRMNPDGGRDHWGNVFSVAFAGGN